MKTMGYIKTGTLKSKKIDVDQGVFNSMSSGRIVYLSGRTLYRRYDTEIWAMAFFSSWAVYAWIKLGQ